MQVTARRGILTPEIAQKVKEQPIFWSDDRNEHYFFDFKEGENWVSSVRINNELTQATVDVF